jgi:hypothetical protein
VSGKADIRASSTNTRESLFLMADAIAAFLTEGLPKISETSARCLEELEFPYPLLPGVLKLILPPLSFH